MATNDDELRGRLLDAAEAQLSASTDGDISTRAICAAVGVGQPVLYRLFGDKRGLLDALSDRGLTRYAGRKAELEVSPDPVADLVNGWEDHMAFAAENEALYQLMFSPRPWSDDRARRGIAELLEATLTRCAAAGALRVPVPVASSILLASNIGLALNRIADPERFGTPAVADAIREAAFAAVLIERSAAPMPAPLAAAAAQLRAQLGLTPPARLVAEEVALLAVWLGRLQES